MKTYNINISEDEILTAIYRLTANAAQQRKDALHVATEDNKDLLVGFIEDGKRVLRKSLGRYAAGGLDYSMPEAWPERCDDIDALSDSFLRNYVLAEWYGLSGEGDRYLAVANVALEDIGSVLGKRIKPTR